MANANRDKGIRAELAVAMYLRTWWPGAERSVAAGFKVTGRTSTDRGDIRDVGTAARPLAIQVKDVTKSHPKGLAGKALEDILRQTREQRDERGAVLGLLIEKRAGHASPAEWWCHLSVGELGGLVRGDLVRVSPADPVRCVSPADAPVRIRFGDLIPLLLINDFATGTARVA